MLGSASLTRAFGRWALILAVSALVSPLSVAQRAIGAQRIDRAPDEEHGRDSVEGHSKLGSNFRVKRISLGWNVEEEQSNRRFGANYSTSLREAAESRLRHLVDAPINIKGLRLINMIDNSQTTDAIHASQLLNSLVVAGASLTRDEVLTTIRQSAGKVILFLAHIREDGSIETKDQFIAIQELAALADSSNVPFLALGCRSANFVSSGYSKEINSFDVVTRLGRTLGTAETFGNVLAGLMTSDDDIQLDWKFLAGATEVLRIKLVDKKAGDRGAIYVGGIRSWSSAPVPQPTRLAYLALETGLPYWAWRGGLFSCLLVIVVWLFELANLSLGVEILKLSSGCFVQLCWFALVFAGAGLIAASGQLVSGPLGMGFFVAALIWIGFCLHTRGLIFDVRGIPEFALKRKVPLGVLGLAVLGFSISAILG